MIRGFCSAAGGLTMLRMPFPLPLAAGALANGGEGSGAALPPAAFCDTSAIWKASFPLTGISSLRSDIPTRLRRAMQTVIKKRDRVYSSRFFIPLCGEGGIRTPGTVIPYVSLANWWFKPLTHLTRHPCGSFVPNGPAKIYYFRDNLKIPASAIIHQRKTPAGCGFCN